MSISFKEKFEFRKEKYDWELDSDLCVQRFLQWMYPEARMTMSTIKSCPDDFYRIMIADLLRRLPRWYRESVSGKRNFRTFINDYCVYVKQNDKILIEQQLSIAFANPDKKYDEIFGLVTNLFFGNDFTTCKHQLHTSKQDNYAKLGLIHNYYVIDGTISMTQYGKIKYYIKEFLKFLK